VCTPEVQKKTSDENFKIFSEIILKASNLAKEKNSNFYFVILPLYPEVIEVTDERSGHYTVEGCKLATDIILSKINQISFKN
jgi:hypothetical protein